MQLDDRSGVCLRPGISIGPRRMLRIPRPWRRRGVQHGIPPAGPSKVPRRGAGGRFLPLPAQVEVHTTDR